MEKTPIEKLIQYLGFVHLWSVTPLVNLKGVLGSRSLARIVTKKLGRICEDIGLAASSKTVARMNSALSVRTTDISHFSQLARDFMGRVQEELAGIVFLSLKPSDAAYYEKSREGWETVLDRFPGSIYDVEESGKSLALGRYTACVFHLMRVLETGLRSLAKTLNAPTLDPTRNPSWEMILRKCDDEMKLPLKDRSTEWKSDELFFSTVTAYLRAVKEAWRNTTMHVERKYNEEEAREVYFTSRFFMRQLATKLSE